MGIDARSTHAINNQHCSSPNFVQVDGLLLRQAGVGCEAGKLVAGDHSPALYEWTRRDTQCLWS
jgi:hypothetical protein